MPLLRRRPRAVLFCNVDQPPWTNNLQPVARAFDRATRCTLIQPFRFPDFVTTGGAAPAPVPAAALESAAAAGRADLVVCVGAGLYVPPEARGRHFPGARFVGIALSDPLGLAASLQVAPHFDLFCTQDPDSVPAYLQAGIGVRRCDLAVDGELYHPEPGPCDREVLFYGKWTPYRDRVVREVARVASVEVHAYPAETRWSVPVLPQLGDPAALRAALSSSLLALECAVMDDAPPPFTGRPRMTPRPQLAAACGTASLVEDFPRLREYLEPGREVLTYAGPEHVADAARAALADPSRLARVGRAARARVLRDQTWQVRVRELLDALGL